MKKNIALVTGGFSGEAVISYKTAKTIHAHLDKELFNTFLIDISNDGWAYVNQSHQKLPVDKNDFTITVNSEKITFDAVFIAMHGTPGEDGKLQGYFDLLKIPYTSCDAATSSLTFNKRYTVAVAGMAGIAVANSVLLIKNKFENPEEIVQTLKFPVFVKPNNGGSSIGMSKVMAASDELGAAIEKAFKEDNQVLVEEMIIGREFTVGVFRAENKIVVLPITEVETTDGKDFFDFEAKYEGKSRETTPANITNIMKSAIESSAKRVYEVFNCRGIVRIDFIYNEENAKPYMLEINTIPGQSEASIVPQQVKVLGWTLQEFYTKIVNECI